MKILHCADLHMDSPMETHMTREQAAKRNAEILMSFQRMTEYAEKEKVRVVLIAGDLFDGERVTRRTVESVLLSLIHISEPTRRTPISYAVFCLKKKKKQT